MLMENSYWSILRNLMPASLSYIQSKDVPSRGGVCGGDDIGILTKCVSKTSRYNVVSKFGIFYHKKRNAEFCQYPVLQKYNFYRR